MKRFISVIKNPFMVTFLVAFTYFEIAGFDILYMVGNGHLTLKYGDVYTQGCICHGFGLPTSTVKVWVVGPESLKVGALGLYNIYVRGGPAVNGGFNVDAGKGYVSPGDSTSYLWGGEDELTHSLPKAFVNDTVNWRFYYTAPMIYGLDTIFSVGNSADGNLDPTGDEYNFGADFLVKIVDTITNVSENGTPAGFHLYPNYPNPFNPTTTISFRLEHQAFVQFSVYDLQGQIVSTIFKGIATPGVHAYRFDGAETSSGMYFCRIHIISISKDISVNNRDFLITRKMVLLK